MTIGENIRKYRKEKGLTQKSLGELCGVNEAQIRRYELGGKNSNPKRETLLKIAKALGISAADLDTDEGMQELYLVDELRAIKKEEDNYLNNLPADEWFSKDFISQTHRFQEKTKDIETRLSNIRINKCKAKSEAAIQASEKKTAFINNLSNAYDQLNSNGHNKIKEYAEDLTKIPEYQKTTDTEE